MDKNTVTGLIIIAGIFIVFSIFNRPDQEELERMQRQQDSIERVEANNRAATEEQQRNIEQHETTQEAQSVEVIDSAQLNEELENEYGAFANAAKGTEKFITIENDLLLMKVSSKGGRVHSVTLKDYQTHDSLPLVLFEGDSNTFGFNFFAQRRFIGTSNMYFESGTNSTRLTADDNPASLSMRLKVNNNQYIEYLYTVYPGDYMVDFDVNFVNMETIIDQNITTIDLFWEQYIPQQEQSRSNELQYTTLAYKHAGDDVEKFNSRRKKDFEQEDIPTKLKWIAYQDQFFSTALIAKDNFNNSLIETSILPEGSKYLKRMRSEIGVPYKGLANYSFPMKYYFGPNRYKTLVKYGDLELQELVEKGNHIVKFFNKYIIIQIFNWLDDYISNYGLIILILTIIIKIALIPLTFKSYMSTAKMRVLKPQIDAINEKIPSDKAMERQQATMNLYRKAGVNPMGGCLPMLLQMPILIAMFRFFPTSIELRQESFLWAHDLSTYDAILTWSENIPLISKFYGNHISLFTILMTVTTMLSMKTNQATASSQQMPGMKGMMYIMPIMFMFILNNFSAGLTYYYFLANLITLGQNALFNRMIDEDKILKKLEAKKAKPKKKSKFQARLEKMAKQQGYNTPKRK